MSSKLKDVRTGIFILILSVFIRFISNNILDSKVSELGPDFMPKIISIAMMIASVILIANGLFSHRKLKSLNNTEEQAESEEENKEELSGVSEKVNFKNVLLTMGLLFLYISLINIVGFIIMTILFIVLQIMIYSEDKKANITRNIFIGAIVTVVIFIIFNYGFNIMIPLGIFS